eukprot:TRINITY_DN41277_c0_g1_i1.p2 TRINITY_DN41277_c0_g1~~TRINITY_DN41277_c0_g1_i1.p2  ORF type:complete len:136 (+),score=27.38 TRINITY_DN41277_c0_g1_i1:65-472(+)
MVRGGAVAMRVCALLPLGALAGLRPPPGPVVPTKPATGCYDVIIAGTLWPHGLCLEHADEGDCKKLGWKTGSCQAMGFEHVCMKEESVGSVERWFKDGDCGKCEMDGSHVGTAGKPCPRKAQSLVPPRNMATIYA